MFMDRFFNKLVCILGLLGIFQGISEADSSEGESHHPRIRRAATWQNLSNFCEPDSRSEQASCMDENAINSTTNNACIKKFNSEPCLPNLQPLADAGSQFRRTMLCVGKQLYTILDDIFPQVIIIYIRFNRPMTECIKFPMFFDIFEDEFPEVLSYLKPSEYSESIVNNILNIQEFLICVYNSIFDIYGKLENVFKLKSFQTTSNEFLGSEIGLENIRVPDPILLIKSINKIDVRYGLCEFKKFVKSIFNNNNFLSVPNFYELCEFKEFEKSTFNNNNFLSISDFHGLYEFKEFVKSTFNDNNFLSIPDFHCQFVEFSERLNSIRKVIRNAWFFCNNSDDLKEEKECARDLYLSIDNILKLLDNDFNTLDGINTISFDLLNTCKQLIFENFKRSNIIEKSFGPAPERRNIIIPDISSVLNWISVELKLLDYDKTMELFSYIVNRQFLNLPIGYYHRAISNEELIKICNDILPLRISK